MKILFLIPYPMGQAPSQRFRFEQYLDFLRDEGHQLQMRPFLNENTWKNLYAHGNALSKAWGIIAGYFKRTNDMITASKADIIFIHREATPLGPPIFEWFVSKVLRKRIIYDFDDAIWLPNTSKQNRLVANLKWHGKVASICKWSWKVSCGNDYLADYANQYASSVHTNPTTIDTDYHRASTKSSSSKITIGWTGTHSTAKYLDKVVPVLQQLEKDHAFRFLMISNEKPDFALESLEYRPWSKASEIEDLQEIDIGIMPLPDTEWARAILTPLVTAAGYDIVSGDGEEGALSIWFEEEFEAAQALEWELSGPVIRLRDQPEAASDAETIYRYDREGLMQALRDARPISSRSKGAAA